MSYAENTSVASGAEQAASERAAVIAESFIIANERDERDNARNATAKLIAIAIRDHAKLVEAPSPMPQEAQAIVQTLVAILAAAETSDAPDDAPCHVDMTFGEARALYSALKNTVVGHD